MSKNTMNANVHLAASSRSNHSGLFTLTALLLGSLALPASAQNHPVARVAPEKHFTIPPDVQTPVVLQTEPDAACDLHPAGVAAPSQTMRLYGNIEGYVRFHFTPKQDTQDAYLQLDCTTPEAVTTHPLHLRIAASPADDMPAPEASVPVPAGSKVLPALTDEAARQLSDEDVIAQGYPPRPNYAQPPAAYARWLGLVSRPMTILPSHSVSRSDISHAPHGVTEGPANNSHWSGFVVTGVPFEFWAASGQWRVPSVSNSCLNCYSSVWAGLDGWLNGNLVQAGTEQDCIDFGKGFMTNYYAWTEAYPQQPTAQQVFSVSPGHSMSAFVYVGDSKGNMNPSGGNYAWFVIQDQSAAQVFVGSTLLGPSFGFLSNSAEWIVERPVVSGYFPELSDYGSVQMSDATFLGFGATEAIPYSQATDVLLNPLGTASQIQQLTMTGSDVAPYYDNNVLSTVSKSTSCPSCMLFTWVHFI
jgi:Peptidase A4 family